MILSISSLIRIIGVAFFGAAIIISISVARVNQAIYIPPPSLLDKPLF
jgi:hypothetical protein